MPPAASVTWNTPISAALYNPCCSDDQHKRENNNNNNNNNDNNGHHFRYFSSNDDPLEAITTTTTKTRTNHTTMRRSSSILRHQQQQQNIESSKTTTSTTSDEEDSITKDNWNEEKDVAKKQRRRNNMRNNFSMTSFRLVNAVIWIVVIILFYQTKNIGWNSNGNIVIMSQQKDKKEVEMSHDIVGPQLPPPLLLSPPNESIVSLSGRADKAIPSQEDQTPESSRMIHVVHTRYMQNQPNLVDLGLARLELLKAFPLESLKQQTSQNFVWIIRTDPNIHETLKKNLVETLTSYYYNRNYLLIASNENPNIQIDNILNLEDTSILSGNVDQVKQYLSQAKELDGNGNGGGGGAILESRLDADDALHKDFIGTVQESARSYFSTATKDNNNNNNNSNYSSWKMWCASRHVEWQYNTLWEEKEDEPQAIGALLSMKDTECISTGLTIGYTNDIKVHSLPPIKHDQLIKSVPSCKKQKHECLDFVSLMPTALRARTPTSAGMLNILLKNNNHKGMTRKKYEKAGATKQVGMQFRLWRLIEYSFGFSKDSARNIHNHMEQNMRAIAEDNLKGQCTAGHSCKESSKEVLKAIIDHPDYV